MNGRNARTPNVGPGNGLRADRFRNLAVPGAPFLPSCSIGLLRLVVVILERRLPPAGSDDEPREPSI
jgi:hypothetical protein